MRLFLILLGLLCWINSTAQQTEFADFKSIKATIHLLPKTQSVKGQLRLSFAIKQNTDSVYIDARDMSVKTLKNPAGLHLSNTGQKIWLTHPFKAGKTYHIQLAYQVQPKQSLYFVGWDNAGSNQIWSQGQGKKTSYWLPSIDDYRDKITFDLTFIAPKDYTVVSNGKLVKHRLAEGRESWKFQMDHPMSSYLVAVAIGHYQKKKLNSSSGVPLYLFYESRFADRVEWTYRYAKEIFDFLEQEIGFPYPWLNYKMIPVRNFLYAGMENTTATIFAESLMTDSIGFIDHNFVNVNAHELAHQWFGDLITQKTDREHWLQEGFATYYALLAERKIFGDEYYYYKLFKSAEKLKALSDKGKGEALTDPKASSLTYYQKGAWALHILREKIGSQAFKKGMQSYLKKYQYQWVTTVDFIAEMEQSSGQDLSTYVHDWIRQTAFQGKQALLSLRKSKFMEQYLDLAALRRLPLKEKYHRLSEALAFPVNPYLGQEAVHQLSMEPTSAQRLSLLKKAFATNNTLVRQAIATSLQEIPNSLKNEYESLLRDPSYLTQEKALFNLWQNFPDDREKYLDQLDHTRGFYNKNIRMMWLTLALVTHSYHPDKNQTYYRELSGYTRPAYDYSIRQNAFGHLYQINSFTSQNYKDLLQACTSKIWRFKKFSKQLLNQLIKEEKHRKELQVIRPLLSDPQKKILDNILKSYKKQ